MPIENLSGIVRLPRMGKIRLGEKVNDGQYPKALDYFRVEEDGGITSEKAARAFHNIYGEKPNVIDIMFPDEDIERFFPQFYTAYTKRGKICQGDGKTARRWTSEDDTRQLVDIPCQGLQCEWYMAKKCRRLATLQIILPKVPGLGVWQISTTSKNGIINVNSGVKLIQNLTGGRVSFIPLKLSLTEAEVLGPDMFSKKIHVLNMADEDICFSDILQAMNTPPIHTLLPDLEEDPRPEDLYPESVIDDNPGQQPASQSPDTGSPARRQFYEKLRTWAERKGYNWAQVQEETDALIGSYSDETFEVALKDFGEMAKSIEFMIVAKAKKQQEQSAAQNTAEQKLQQEAGNNGQNKPSEIEEKVKITNLGKLEDYQGKKVRVALVQDGRKIVLSPSLKIKPGMELHVNGTQIFSNKSNTYIILPRNVKTA